MFERTCWLAVSNVLGSKVHDFRHSLGLPPSGATVNHKLLALNRVPFLYCFSEALVPKPNDWPSWVHVPGFWFLDQTGGREFEPPADLAEFLAAGEPPLYIGFGSITGIRDPAAFRRVIVEAVALSGQRAILASGWGLAAADEDEEEGGEGGGKQKPGKGQIFSIGECPHDWLFPRVAAVCHHGGAGTTAAGLLAGKPTVVVRPPLLQKQNNKNEKQDNLQTNTWQTLDKLQ
jgi:UDP:flavonoid glycosyltransferase YjiC (YdhE family)